MYENYYNHDDVYVYEDDYNHDNYLDDDDEEEDYDV